MLHNIPLQDVKEAAMLLSIIVTNFVARCRPILRVCFLPQDLFLIIDKMFCCDFEFSASFYKPH